MKKTLALVLCLVLAFAMAGCGKDSVPKGGKLMDAPELIVKTSNQTVTAMLGTRSWMYHVNGDAWRGLEADSFHPLDESGRDIIPVLRYDTSSTTDHMKPKEAILLFGVAPDSVTVRCWDEEYWGYPENDGKAESLPCDGPDFRIELKDSGAIYEVIAEWNSSSDYHGVARYSFYAAPASVESGHQ